MLTRRDALTLLGSLSAGTLLGARRALGDVVRQGDATPSLAPGAPDSPERQALIDAFRTRSEGIEQQFEKHVHRGASGSMPYRLFRPKATGPLPLVVFLHGSAGQGTDNEKQMGAGNVFGTRVWAMPDHQARFPCVVVAPQTERGWIRYGPPAAGDSIARPIPGLGDGARLALEVIDALRRDLTIDERRIYLTGQSMGGSGVWHLMAQRPRLFAAAAVCCGTATVDDTAAAAGIPVWNFHGDADAVVPVSISRARVAALRSAGGRPLYTEYAGVGHNVWLWAYTEPALLPWLFSKRRAG
jgi:predicted peptidase